MSEIRKRILTDEANRPVAVQIDYDDWVRIERTLQSARSESAPVDLARFVGVLEWGEDAVAYQRRVREEWNG